MKLAFNIAKRFLKSGKSQTWMIILGIAIGVSVQVFIGSLITGLQKSLVDKTIGSSSQVTIYKDDNENPQFNQYESVIAVVEDMSDDYQIVSPVLDQNGILINDQVSQTVLVRGFEFDKANQLYHFDEKIVDGVLPSNLNEIALGKNLFDELGLSLNDNVTFQIPIGGNVTYEVVGVFDFNVQTINSVWVITTLSTLQTSLNLPGYISKIETQITDVFMAQELSDQLQAKLVGYPELVVDNWMNQNAELLSGLQGQSISSLMIQIFVMVSVVLGIASVLAITVLQKSKQLGILKAMGIKDKDASLVFLFQGLILGFFGAILGVLFGLGLSVMFTTFAIDSTTGNPVVPLYIDYGFIALSAGIAVLASMVASIIPARKSSKLSVIEVIRNA